MFPPQKLLSAADFIFWMGTHDEDVQDSGVGTSYPCVLRRAVSNDTCHTSRLLSSADDNSGGGESSTVSYHRFRTSQAV